MKKQPVISVRGLSHVFGDGAMQKEVLHEVSADFFPGEIVIITGPSGSGKTTFLTLAGALRSIQAGEVLVRGQGLRQLSDQELMMIRRRMGFVFQAHNLIESLTACENVQMAMVGDAAESTESSREKALACLLEVGLGEHAHKKPNKLSGGQKQRVAIARSLVRRPDIILADEPTAALDKKTGREVVDLLYHLAKRTGCTILLVTHDNRILDVADRIIHIEDGRLEESHISMERIMAQLRLMMKLLSLYPSCWLTNQSSGLSLNELQAEFFHTVSPLNRKVVDLSHGQIPAGLARIYQSLIEILNHCMMLEETVTSLGNLIFKDTVIEPTLTDPIVQSTDFLLSLARDTVDNPTSDAMEMFKLLTYDRSELLENLRSCYFAGTSEIGQKTHQTLFTATQMYSRIVYFLRNLVSRYFEITQFLSNNHGSID